MRSNNNANSEIKREYWEQYYSKLPNKSNFPPSQFAAFMAQEVNGADLIFEVGCGNGRDSVFFADRGFRVVAVDGSHAAIERCNEAFTQQRPNLSFRHAIVGTDGFAGILENAVRECGERAAIIYARFFLHAVTESEEDALLAAASRYLKPGDAFAAEYRTVRDKPLAKATADHYRRFIAPHALFMKALDLRFTLEYAVEGFGFAKYLTDDAYVARSIFRKI